MAKRVKVYGPANDNVPEEELFLAAIIQNAKAFGMKPTKGAFARYENGRALDLGLSGAAKVCALGAHMLAPTSYAQPMGVVAGNDGAEWETNDPGIVAGFAVGRAFQLAMGK
jgi:hypothetical protein